MPEKKNRKRLKPIAALPSLMTLLNAVCGFTAINFAARGLENPHELFIQKPELTFFAAAAIMIFLGMIADALDGRLARMAQTTSSFGGQLDSMSDMLTFGAAPAILMLWMVESSISEIRLATPVFGTPTGKLLWLTAALYISCCALRLARFNVQNELDESAHMDFEGLPSPAAAGVLASLVLLLSDISSPGVTSLGVKIIIYSLPCIAVICGLLMVSQVPYRHVVNHLIRGAKPFNDFVKLVFVILLLFWKLKWTLAACFLFFAFSGAIRWIWQKYIRKSPASLGEDHLASEQDVEI